MEEDKKKTPLIEERNQIAIDNHNQGNDSVQFDSWFWVRATFVFFALGFVIANAVYGFVMPNSHVDCMLDKFFEITSGINKYLQDNVTPRHVIIAISSLCVDFVIVYMSLHWVIWGKSWRLVVSLFSFYMFRAAVQSVFQMKYPEGYLWENPGFPSLTISYLKTNDFFFSGHVGFPIIVAMECYNLHKPFMTIFCFLTCSIEAATMIITRGHYSIDILTGLIVSHYVYILVEKHIHVIDDSCIGMNKKEAIDKPDEEKMIPVPFTSSNPSVTTNTTTV
jgi:hypothetical protein